MRVSGECPTAISSLDEGECESGISGQPRTGSEDHSDTPHMCSEELGRVGLLTWWLPTHMSHEAISAEKLTNTLYFVLSALLDTPTILGIAAEKFD